jgi:guanylate kinase
MSFAQRLFVIVGTPGSGKDILIRAVDDIGYRHAQIVPKHTSRKRRKDDRKEMICPGDPGYNLDACDIIYENYGDKYGIEYSRIWEGLKKGTSQVIAVSNVDAINKMREIFGEFMVLVYVHSGMSPDEYRDQEAVFGEDAQYIERRAQEYPFAFEVYRENLLAFDHVLINSDLREDLFDQIFRLFRAYERGDI